jgi:hypothetical protein
LFYYLSELRNRVYPRAAFQAVILAVVVLAVGYGFYAAGSPQNQRLVRFDEQKINDLQTIQSRIVYYWQQKGALPSSLEVLNDPIASFSVPQDPQSKGSYEYHAVGVKSFQLCAVFNRSDTADTFTYDSSWQHGSGRICFDRNIDQQLYPVNPGKPIPVPLN